MPCYSPNALARDRYGETRFISGHHIRQSLFFKSKIGLVSSSNKAIAYKLALNNTYHPMEIFPIACKSCIGCRLYHSREWAIRCTHENQMHSQSSFLTLTYNDDNLPKNKTLLLEDIQKFFKRLRINLERAGLNHKIRYMYCGEYGEGLGRPHYHVILFGQDFNHDKKPYRRLKTGFILYISQILDKSWQKGFAYVGSVTFESAAYVARYIDKKVNGTAKTEHYTRIDEHGEVNEIKQEWATASHMKPHPEALGGGLGSSWFEKYHTDVYPSDEVIMKGKKMRPPAYYDTLLERLNPTLLEEIKNNRKMALQQLNNDEEQSHERLLVKETVKLAQISQLIRPLK